MSGFLRRAAAVVAGILLGMLIVAGMNPWRELFRKPGATPPAPIQRERAPDTRA